MPFAPATLRYARALACVALLWLGLLCPVALAGPYAGAVGTTGTAAIAAGDPRFQGWANAVYDYQAGPQQLSDPDLGEADYGQLGYTLGMANTNPLSPYHVWSLGDGGHITLSFPVTIANGVGPDFAVFENAFNDTFLELGYVSVSTDGLHFVTFPSVSLTPLTSQINGDDLVGPLGAVDPTNIHNLAGKYRAGYGTPFDLQDLVGQPGSEWLNFTDIRYIRVTDVVGWIDSLTPTRDSLGNIINDPWATPYLSSGFDLDGIGVLNTVPEPGPVLWLTLATAAWCARRPRAARRQLSVQLQPRRAAFTLVELLVVLSIISLLAVLLIAAAVPMAQARGEATQCLSNLRQLAAANLTYASEHDGNYAPAQDITNTVRWHGQRGTVEQEFDPAAGPLAPYLGGNGRVKECPSLHRYRTSSETFEQGTGGYGYNAVYIGGLPGNPFQSERIANVANPARTVMFTDTAFPRADGLQEYPYCEPWLSESPRDRFRGKLNASVHFRHSERANVAWCDGHVTAEKASRLDGSNTYGGNAEKWQIGWFGPSAHNGYWRPY